MSCAKYLPVPGSSNRFVLSDGSGVGVYLFWYGRYLRLWEDEDESGHLRVCASWKGAKENRVVVHLLVWAAFYGVPPTGWVVDHRNNNPKDNRLSNLQLLRFGDHNNKHGKPKAMLAGRGEWKPRYRCPVTGRFTGGELPPEVTQ